VLLGPDDEVIPERSGGVAAAEVDFNVDVDVVGTRQLFSGGGPVAL